MYAIHILFNVYRSHVICYNGTATPLNQDISIIWALHILDNSLCWSWSEWECSVDALQYHPQAVRTRTFMLICDTHQWGTIKCLVVSAWKIFTLIPFIQMFLCLVQFHLPASPCHSLLVFVPAPVRNQSICFNYMGRTIILVTWPEACYFIS
jgi:hypothetical protein